MSEQGRMPFRKRLKNRPRTRFVKRFVYPHQKCEIERILPPKKKHVALQTRCFSSHGYLSNQNYSRLRMRRVPWGMSGSGIRNELS
jgi:hypothetical protein